MSTEKLIQAAEAYAAKYNDDPRDCIKTDVLNAFYAGHKYALASYRASVDGVELPEGEAEAWQVMSKDGGHWGPPLTRLSIARQLQSEGHDVRSLYTAATIRRLIAEAVERERERCAKVCEDQVYSPDAPYDEASRAAIYCASAIREGGK